MRTAGEPTAIERRQAEAQLAESETRYRSLIELAL